MNYETYTHTYYNLYKRTKNNGSILTLSKFKNNTLNIETPMTICTFNESIYNGLSDGELINTNTGEVILQWDNDKILYIDTNYEIKMTQRQESTNEPKEILSHNNYIKSKLRNL